MKTFLLTSFTAVALLSLAACEEGEHEHHHHHDHDSSVTTTTTEETTVQPAAETRTVRTY